MATIECGIDEFIVTVLPHMATNMQLSMRDTVNELALAVTQDARRELKGYIGPEQRISGQQVSYTWSVEGGRRVRGGKTKGGIKINPHFLEAQSLDKPYAVLGVRGPAQRTEHHRKGGYDIVPRRKKGSRKPGRTGNRKAAFYRPAMLMPDGRYRYALKGTEYTPPAPITKAFNRARQTANARAQEMFDKKFDQRFGAML